jgi:hypothetical protein
MKCLSPEKNWQFGEMSSEKKHLTPLVKLPSIAGQLY